MTDHREAIAGIFDRAAATYDQLGVEFFTTVGRTLVEDVRIGEGAHVLDAGCGRGAALFAAAAATGPAGVVLGIDLAPSMVELTAVEAAERGLTNVTVEVQDAQEPRLAPASFDVVLSSLVIFFLPDPLAALRAWHEALRSPGRLGLATFANRDDERWSWLDEVFPTRDRRSTQPGKAEGESPFDTDERLHALLVEAGYAEPRSRTREHVLSFADPDAWLRWSWSHGMRMFWERTPEADRPAAEARAVQELTRMATEPAGLTLRNAVRYTTASRP